MRRRIITLFTIFILLIGIGIPVYAITDEQAIAIQFYLDETRSTSMATGMAAAVVTDGETHFFFSGVTNRATGMVADEETRGD